MLLSASDLSCLRSTTGLTNSTTPEIHRTLHPCHCKTVFVRHEYLNAFRIERINTDHSIAESPEPVHR
jgi:hypothetical protein